MRGPEQELCEDATVHTLCPVKLEMWFGLRKVHGFKVWVFH